MINILVYLFVTYNSFSSHPKPDTLARKLSSVGFEEDEILVALKWLAGLKSAQVTEFINDRRSLRIYSAEERQKFDPECLSFIFFLETTNVLTPALRELVIEQGMELQEKPVPLTEFKIVVLMVLWSLEQNLEPLIIGELLHNVSTYVPSLPH